MFSTIRIDWASSCESSLSVAGNWQLDSRNSSQWIFDVSFLMLYVNSYFPEYELMHTCLLNSSRKTDWGFQYSAPVSVVASSKMYKKWICTNIMRGGDIWKKNFSLYLCRTTKNRLRSWIFCVPAEMRRENADHRPKRIRNYCWENKKTSLLKYLIYFVLIISCFT
jgi:hypothetical protein